MTTREEYAEALIEPAQALARIVRSKPEEIRAAITSIYAIPAPDDIDPTEAIITTLAAMVDTTRTAKQLLGWAYQTPVEPPVDLNVQAWAIHRALNGELPASALSEYERTCVVGILALDEGRPVEWIAGELEATERDVARWIERARRRREEAEAA